ncbi:metal homeostatis protein-like protein bsd2, partial [Rhizodiscina lignyota]
SSRHLLSEQDPLVNDADRTLHDTFDSPSDDEGSDDGRNSGDDRQRLMRANSSQQEASNGDETTTMTTTTTTTTTTSSRQGMQRRVTELPTFVAQTASQWGSRVFGGGSTANDGVFANLSAKPTRGEDVEEKPPTYEQAAADATPPYWETTILAPGMVSDEVFVDGLPVGSVFSFIWNGMISMSFQIVGFLLTYLLHTTHAAKNGSRAGLGITLVQYGFSLKGSSIVRDSNPAGTPDNVGPPPDPNSHNFDPNLVQGGDSGPATGGGDASAGGLTTSDWFAYILMIVGWFILIRAISDFLRARKHEQLVLQSPDRGLGVPVVAEGEQPETSV